jgi:hypothetical protein
MDECLECARLLAENEQIYAEYVEAMEEMSMTSKNDPAFMGKGQDFARLGGLLRQSMGKIAAHRKESHPGVYFADGVTES